MFVIVASVAMKIFRVGGGCSARRMSEVEWGGGKMTEGCGEKRRSRREGVGEEIDSS